jgi:hypothetical protein
MVSTRTPEFCQSDDTTEPQGSGIGDKDRVSGSALVRGEMLRARQGDYCARTRASREEALQIVRWPRPDTSHPCAFQTCRYWLTI